MENSEPMQDLSLDDSDLSSISYSDDITDNVLDNTDVSEEVDDNSVSDDVIAEPSHQNSHITIDPQTLAAISNMSPNYDEVHSNLLQSDSNYAELVELISNESSLDSYLFNNNEEYHQLSSKEEKDAFRNEVSNILKSSLSEKLQQAGDEYLSHQKQILLNDIRLSDFENYLSSNEAVKPLIEFSDALYQDILSNKSLEDNQENRSFFNKAINSFVIDISHVFDLNEKEFARSLGKILSNKSIPAKAGLKQFNNKVVSLKEAQSKARSITGQSIDNETYLEDDDSWSRFN